MSRFDRPLPFSPAMKFEAAKVVTIAGTDYLPGDPVAESLDARLLRRLYESRRIAPIDPAKGPALKHAAPKPEPKAKAPKAKAKADDKNSNGADSGVSPSQPAADSIPSAAAAAGGDPAPSADPIPAWSVVKPAMGGWRVLDATGAPVGDSYETEAEAQAALEALTAG